MVTTIKIHQGTKSALDDLKKEHESYDNAIKRIVEAMKHKDLKNQLIEGYKSMGKEDLETLEEWEIASKEI